MQGHRLGRCGHRRRRRPRAAHARKPCARRLGAGRRGVVDGVYHGDSPGRRPSGRDSHRRGVHRESARDVRAHGCSRQGARASAGVDGRPRAGVGGARRERRRRRTPAPDQRQAGVHHTIPVQAPGSAGSRARAVRAEHALVRRARVRRLAPDGSLRHVVGRSRSHGTGRHEGAELERAAARVDGPRRAGIAGARGAGP